VGLSALIGICREVINFSDVLLGVLNILRNIISFGIVLLIGFKKTKRQFNDVFKFNKISLFLWIAITVFIIGYVIIISELDNILTYVLPVPEMLRGVSDTLTGKEVFIISLVITGILPSFTEELFFRGLILDGLKNNYSTLKSVLISTLIFGVIHLNPWQLLSAFILGLFSAWICINTNSIILCIFMHLFNNILYTITIEYKNIIPIKGFNASGITPIEFQPLWFDIVGLVILIIGIILLRKGFKDAKTCT
jgi:membrane protease YdiL (CAAX protease family)